jgi:hypothetical protein
MLWEAYKTKINTLCGQSVKFFDKLSGKYSNHWALESWVKRVDSSPQSSQQQMKHAHMFRENGKRSQNNEAWIPRKFST